MTLIGTQVGPHDGPLAGCGPRYFTQQDRGPAEAIIKGSPYGDRVTWLDPGEDITLPV